MFIATVACATAVLIVFIVALAILRSEQMAHEAADRAAAGVLLLAKETSYQLYVRHTRIDKEVPTPPI